MSFFWDVIRGFLFAIDSIVYEFIITVYNLFMEIANTTIFSDDIINIFLGKVYALLGIFMLFKVSFSLLSYIANPDQFVDKNKGLNKIVITIITSLALLVFTPYIFKQAMDLQRIILKENTIPKLFVTNANITTTLNGGEDMALTTFQAFFTNQDDTRITVDHISEIFDYDINKKDSDGNYIFKYTFIISTLAGVIELLLLINFCFDIAVRSIKLGFLRMVAPIPIIARIDPKKGTETFNKWTKLCINTYLDLFIRLIAIYFAIFIISQVTTNFSIVDAVTGETTEASLLAIVFIIMGALLFAKQLPKLLEDLLGVKLSGEFTLNPLKKVSTVPVIGKSASLLAGTFDSAVHGNGIRAGFVRNWNGLDNFIKGGDGKTSIFDTADKKLRKEVAKKRDTASQRYEALKSRKDLEEKMNAGREYKNEVESAMEKARIKAEEDIASGKVSFQKEEDIQDYVKGEMKKAKAAIDRSHFKNTYETKAAMDAAKDKMYKAEQRVNEARDNHQAQVNKYGVGSKEADDAYKKYVAASKNYGTAQGNFNYQKEQHEIDKKIHVKDAELEDSIEAYEKMYEEKVGDSINKMVEEKYSGNENNTQSNNTTGGSNNSSNNSTGGSNNSSNNPTGGSNNSSNNPTGGSNNSSNNTTSGSNNSSNNTTSGSNNSSNNTTSGSNTQSNNTTGGSNTQSNNTTGVSNTSNGNTQSNVVEAEAYKQQKQRVEQLRNSVSEAENRASQIHTQYLNSFTNTISEDSKANIASKNQQAQDELESLRINLDREQEKLETMDNIIRVNSPENYSTTSTNVSNDETEKLISNALKSLDKDNIYRFKCSSTDKSIGEIAIELMKYKEKNIKAIANYNGVMLDNQIFNSTAEINNYYTYQINNR